MFSSLYEPHCERLKPMHTQKHLTMNDSIGRLLSLLLVLNSVINVPITAVWSVGSNDTVVVKAGDNVTLRCSAESKEETRFFWHYYPPRSNSTSHTDLELSNCDADSIQRCRRIAVETEGNVSVLNITGVQLEDAGKYECQNKHSSVEETIFSKELIIIVIDDYSRCSSTYHKYFDNKITNRSANQRGSEMELHCEVGFNSSPNATDQCILEWRIVGSEEALSSSKCIVGDNSVKATLTLDAASHSNDTSYVCVLRGSSGVEQYSCETGPIKTPLSNLTETPLTSLTETPLARPTETPLTRPTETLLTGAIETPSPTCKCNEDVPKVQPEPLTESPNELMWRQCFTRISLDHQFLLKQQTTNRKVSKLENTQQQLLSAVRELLKAGVKVIESVAPKTMNSNQLENIDKPAERERGEGTTAQAPGDPKGTPENIIPLAVL